MPTTGIIKGSAIGLYINDKLLALGKSHSITINMETRDISSKSSGSWQDFAAGLLSWEVSGSHLEAYDVNDAKSSSGILLNAMLTRIPIQIKYTTNVLGDRVFSGTVFITSFTEESPDGDNVSYSYSLKGKGKLECLESVFYADTLFVSTLLNTGTQLNYTQVINA